MAGASPAEQRVEFDSHLGDRLVGLFRDAGTRKAVVLCHGYTDTKEGFRLAALAAAVVDGAGLGTLRFDFSGNGESAGTFQFGNYLQEAEEIRAAVQLLRERFGQEVIAVLGHSKGGDDVVLFASKYHDVPFIINVAGRFDLTEGITQRFGADILQRLEREGSINMPAVDSNGRRFTFALTKQSMDERLAVDMAAAAREVSSEVLTIHGSADKTIPVGDAYKFDEVIRRHSLFVVDGADHNFRSQEHAQRMIDKVVEYLKLAAK